MRNTVKTLLQDHDVYITDWHNPRDIPLSAGTFGLDEFTEHLIEFLEVMGAGSHLVAICQPCVSALAAAAIMSEDDNPAKPASLTLMAGPIDTRISPTKVNEFATSHSLDWFERNMINYVPLQCGGALRKVYPGFIQVTAFVTMNLERHIKQHVDLLDHLSKGETEKADAIKTFYDEYFAVMDLPADFFLETVRDVFQQHLLPQGKLTWRGRNGECRRGEAHGADDGGRREGRHLLDRADGGGAGSVFRRARLSQGASHAGGRRALWRVQRPALEQRNLSAAARFHPRQFVECFRMTAAHARCPAP